VFVITSALKKEEIQLVGGTLLWRCAEGRRIAAFA